MKLAAIQFRPDKGDWEASVEALSVLVEQAIQHGADLIVCPEMALTGYLFPDRTAAAQVAEPAHTGRTFQRLAPLARSGDCYLVIGYPERDPAQGDLLYNSALVIGPDGELLANYRKRLLYTCDRTWAQPGDEPYLLLPTRLGTLTVGICMDLNDDEFTDFLLQEQPNIVAFCTNWVHEGFDIRPYWHHRLRGVRTYFVAANTYGEEQSANETVRFLGCSAILTPDKKTLALAPEIGDRVLIVCLTGH